MVAVPENEPFLALITWASLETVFEEAATLMNSALIVMEFAVVVLTLQTPPPEDEAGPKIIFSAN